MTQLSCHLIGMNPYNKKEFIQELNNKIFNVIDLDTINQLILKNPELDKLYNMYIKLKNDKNDKFKEVDKKMSTFWETNFIQNVEDKVKKNKVNILIGMNNHYKSLSRKIPIDCTNKFIVKSLDGSEDEASSLIKYNLDTYRNEIIAGTFPLDYINKDYLIKKRILLETSYKKFGYIEKTLEEIKNIINLIESNKTKNKNKEIWLAMKEPYNIGSLIHPKQNCPLNGYCDPKVAIISSINFGKNEERKTVKDIKETDFKKLKTKRYLYLVENSTYVPDKNIYFSQLPVKILAKEKINNIKEYLSI
jgi:hypothetical protein